MITRKMARLRFENDKHDGQLVMLVMQAMDGMRHEKYGNW
jgi:hypothetical protein